MFRDGVKKTYHNVLSASIEDGTFCKFRTKTGQLILINTQNVLSIEVYPRGKLGDKRIRRIFAHNKNIPACPYTSLLQRLE